MTWMMAHPWMTFCLAALALSAAKEIVKSICDSFIEKWHTKERMNTLNFYNKPCREDPDHESDWRK